MVGAAACSIIHDHHLMPDGEPPVRATKTAQALSLEFRDFGVIATEAQILKIVAPIG
jgi:hypothetical protein